MCYGVNFYIKLLKQEWIIFQIGTHIFCGEETPTMWTGESEEKPPCVSSWRNWAFVINIYACSELVIRLCFISYH